jgi:hypothetical protein
MTTSQPDVRSSLSDTPQTLKRRGLLAAGAAFVAGLVAKLSETSVSAGVDGDVVLGATNTTPGLTQVECSTPGGTGLQGLCDVGTNGWGVYGRGTQAGVFGVSDGTGSPGAGVWAFGAPNSPGVRGFTGRLVDRLRRYP